LAARADDISETTIRTLENGRRPADEKIAAICRALESAGVEFKNGGEPGVKLKAKARTIAAGDLNASNDE
jgi:hypothetical protein